MRLFILTTVLFLSLKANAQHTEKIETDRPDQTETPYLVPKKYFQAEIGFNIQKYQFDYSQVVHPTSVLKYGLTNRFELRLESNFITQYLHYIPETITNTVLAPVELGTKVRLFEEKGLLPKTSIIAHIGLPFLASKQFHSAPATYTARVSMQNSLSDNVALGYNVGVEGGGGEPTAVFYTFAPGFNIGEKWYTYVEAFGSFADGGAEHNLDGGIAYFTSKNTQIDLSAGFGLGESSLKHYVALGFSFRLPTGKH
ncbi:MAG: transporter [Flavisolibacter sp.]|nr:transporter [Flavisolibacter sp.]